MKKLPLLLLLILLLPAIGRGQSSVDLVPNLVPPSPDALSLIEHMQHPVDYYSGLPKIQIPLGEVAGASVKVPISLSYHAGGIRVNEFANAVGIGWRLNAGGAVSRIVRSKPDDMNGFMAFQEQYNYNDLANGSSASVWTGLETIANGCGDAEPDEFFFSVDGINGKFAFNWDGELVVSANEAVEITPTFESNDQTKPILSFKIKAGNGKIYNFSDIDYTQIKEYGNRSCIMGLQFASSWYLTSIESQMSPDKLTFEYQSYNTAQSFVTTEVIRHYLSGDVEYCGPVSLNESSTHTSTTLSSGRAIKKITANNGHVVEFFYLTPREDLEGALQPEVNQLDSIVFSFQGEEVKSFNLLYNYSTGRLTLSGITEIGENSKNIEKFRFGYNGRQLPALNSKSQDHWGYYNGKSNNSLVPTQIVYNPNLGTYTKYNGADRGVNSSAVQAGILTSITYPTGGITEFEYEPQDYGYTQAGKLQEYKKIPKNPSISKYGDCLVGNCDMESVEEWVESDPFVLVKHSTVVKISYGLQVYGEPYFGMNRAPRVDLVKDDGEVVYSFRSLGEEGSFITRLEAGTYKWKARAFWRTEDGYDFAWGNASYEEESDELIKKKLAGGVRIKKIQYLEREGDPSPLEQDFSYEMPDGFSSGVIYAEPEYLYSYNTFVQTGEYTGAERECGHFYRLTQNMLMLGSTNGSHIGYKRINTFEGGSIDAMGETVFEYKSPTDYPDAIKFSPPFCPPASYSFKTGLESKQEVNDKRSNLLKTSTKDYYFSSINIPALKVTFKGGTTGEAYLYKYDRVPYNLVLGISKPKVVETIKYSVEGGYNEKVNFTYTSGLLQLRSEDRNNGLSVTDYYYPQDFTALPSAHIFQKMKAKGIVSIPVERISSKVVAGSKKLTNAQLTLYKDVNSFIYPDKAFSRDVQQTEDVVTGPQLGNNLQTKYPYEEIIYERFDTKGNLTQYRSKDGTVSMLYGYNKVYPIAKVENAVRGEIFYTSFEETGEGNIEGNAKTGRKSFSGSYVVELPEAPGEYELSYWIFENGKWEERYETLSADKTLTGHIDEVRVQPKDALMTTYTYKPGVGLTSQTTPSGVTTYYEYDIFDRLQYVRDASNNILKAYEYKYNHSQPASLKGNIEYSPTSAYVGEPVSFQVTANENNPADAVYTWNINAVEYEGQSGIQHTFSQGGTYTASLTISHPAYEPHQVNKTLTVDELSSATLVVEDEVNEVSGELHVYLRVEPNAETNNMEYQLEYKDTGSSSFSVKGTYSSKTFDAIFTNYSTTSSRTITLRGKVSDGAGNYVYTNEENVTVPVFDGQH